MNIVGNPVHSDSCSCRQGTLGILSGNATCHLHILVVGHIVHAHAAAIFAIQHVASHICVHSAIDVIGRAGGTQVYTDSVIALFSGAGFQAYGQSCSHLHTGVLGQIINIICVGHRAVLESGIGILLQVIHSHCTRQSSLKASMIISAQLCQRCRATISTNIRAILSLHIDRCGNIILELSIGYIRSYIRLG